jgi:hypothetical protein
MKAIFLVLTTQLAANRKILANSSELIMQKREMPQQETLAQLIARLIIAFEEKQAKNATTDRVA